MKYDIKKAQKHLAKIKESMGKTKSILSATREKEIIEKIRKDREKIWEEKFAARS